MHVAACRLRLLLNICYLFPQISLAFKNFGVSAETTSLLAVLIDADAPKLSEIASAVAGEPLVDVQAGIERHRDVERIMTRYGLLHSDVASVGLIDAVVTRMALREV